MNESEPLMKCRENVLSVKTTGSLCRRKNAADNLFTGCVTGVMKGA